ncbi:tetratricopeptide repeat protein [Devosia sp. Naph2]|uniref:tetratricopeptide repeat protein n=1 Tax=Devosia polycyclovorans TaxID=3345148 RepID=UPI0035CF2077
MVHLMKTTFLGLAIGLALSVSGQSQELARAASAGDAAPRAVPIIDESALRYFARQGDERRLQAETARLSALYPGWTPPADPLAMDSGFDEQLQTMWDLYGQGDLEGVHAAIEARRAATPEWRPPQDLLDALASGSAAAELRSAAAVQDYSTFISLAANHADLLTCGNVDLLWSLAEAFVDTGKETRGLDAYGYILENCTDPEVRLATMQKAGTMLASADLETLFSFERDGEFGPVRLDRARAAVADYLNGVVRQIDADALAMVEESVATSRSADDLRLLGYYELQRNQSRRARNFFEMALEIDQGEASVSALALALAQMRDLERAEELLSEHRYDTPQLEAQYLSVASALLSGDPPRRLATETLERIIEAVSDAEDHVGAQALGWYAFNFGQAQTASRWFEKSLEYNPDYEPAAYGLLVASQKLQDRNAVRDIIRRWGAVSPRIELFGQPGAPTEAPEMMTVPDPDFIRPAVFRMDMGPRLVLAASQTPAHARAFALCGTFLPPESLSPAQALPRAWCLMELERSAEAASNFERAILSQSANARTEAYYGLTLAYLRLGLIEEAAVSAAAMPQSAERVTEMQVALLGSTAVTYYGIGRYDEVLQLLDQRAMLAPEQNDLLTIRAWSYYHLGRLREAQRIFAAVAATGYQDAQRGLDALAARGWN